MAKKVLGRGLAALLTGADDGSRQKGIIDIDVNRVVPNPYQPRKRFAEAELGELAASILEHGVVQPIVVTRKGDDYQLVVGERRWRAAQAAGLLHVPALIQDLTDREVLEIALVENLQREDLNPVEEGEAYRLLIQEFGITQEELARRVGKSRPAITNTLRLLNSPPEVREALTEGSIAMGHARALLALESDSDKLATCRRIVDEGLSVRATELLVQRLNKTGSRETLPRKSALSWELVSVQDDLERALGTRVRIRTTQGKKGRIEISFFSAEDVERITGLLRHLADLSARSQIVEVSLL
ncbi:MAG: ParB/RepB/Spo0J family partition protein [Armatimonadetes bacterium]|nr:ParB/RepB/Spo0J family partition protein [Armatimonadota bacterium]